MSSKSAMILKDLIWSLFLISLIVCPLSAHHLIHQSTICINHWNVYAKKEHNYYDSKIKLHHHQIKNIHNNIAHQSMSVSRMNDLNRKITSLHHDVNYDKRNSPVLTNHAISSSKWMPTRVSDNPKTFNLIEQNKDNNAELSFFVAIADIIYAIGSWSAVYILIIIEYVLNLKARKKK